MLKIVKRESILWPVKVYEPRDDGTGKTDERVIKIRYKLLTVSEGKEMSESDQRYDEYVKDRILGWEGIADENGPLEFNRTNLDIVMDLPYLQRPILNTFLEAQTKSTEKN